MFSFFKKNKYINIKRVNFFNFMDFRLYKLLTKSGFSLLEMIIYISILTIVLAIVINLTLLMTKSYSSMKVSHNINNSALSIMERLTREIRWSDNIDENSVFGSDSSFLILNTLNDSQESLEKRFYIEDGDFIIEQSLSDKNILNGDSVSVSKFLLTEIITPVSKMIKIELTLNSEWKGKSKSETFYNSIVLRESY